MEIIGQSTAITKVTQLISQVSKTTSNVLITGESGTGKELIARRIHLDSARQAQPFVPINCAAIPHELLESELFGHEKGAFTGAVTTRQGRFEVANQGTIFLDEIGDMPLSMQVKLLRVIQERCFERVGGYKSIKTDVRIIAATHQNLEHLIQKGEFREDLFYRLNVFPIIVPPLRERREDIPLLIHYFLKQFALEFPVCSFSPQAEQQLMQYNWLGNIRELANIVERLCIMYPNQTIEPKQLPDKILHLEQPQLPATNAFEEIAIMRTQPMQAGFNLKEYLINLEMELIQQALAMSQGVVAQAAHKLGIRRTTLVEKMKKYQINNGKKQV